MKVLVTGATRGIGQAIAQYFHEYNHYVVGTGTMPASFIPLQPYLDEYYQADFHDEHDIDLLVRDIKDLEIDVLINNAGINIVKNFESISSKDWMAQHQVNVYAPFRLCQAVLPGMVERGQGHIINIGSVWSRISKTGRAAYSANKFALEGMTKALAAEFSQHGVCINCVSPGFVDTDLTRQNLGEAGIKKIMERVPMGRLASPREIANNVYNLVHSRYITGQNIVIDGGFTSA